MRVYGDFDAARRGENIVSHQSHQLRCSSSSGIALVVVVLTGVSSSSSSIGHIEIHTRTFMAFCLIYCVCAVTA